MTKRKVSSLKKEPRRYECVGGVFSWPGSTGAERIDALAHLFLGAAQLLEVVPDPGHGGAETGAEIGDVEFHASAHPWVGLAPYRGHVRSMAKEWQYISRRLLT